MKVRIAYIEEPPFYWTGQDHAATGADIELAEVVLRAMSAPVGAFSFRIGNDRLLHDVNRKLSGYLGSADHRSRMAKYGIMKTEIDSVIGR